MLRQTIEERKTYFAEMKNLGKSQCRSVDGEFCLVCALYLYKKRYGYKMQKHCMSSDECVLSRNGHDTYDTEDVMDSVFASDHVVTSKEFKFDWKSFDGTWSCDEREDSMIVKYLSSIPKCNRQKLTWSKVLNVIVTNLLT